ncbi:hypothetical protein AB0M46_00810 [Dactylosporangium sp. NPDC051485]|uniref:hypothetical protein n=1 Tax=Dactylosporangium sp. NPDC051485 TaxID=3154846 RepID=UPI003416B4F4
MPTRSPSRGCPPGWRPVAIGCPGSAHRYTPPAPLPRIDGLPDELAEVCAASLDKLPVPIHVPPVLRA